jgi:Skp family chaperone for outer membrane proteins
MESLKTLKKPWLTSIFLGLAAASSAHGQGTGTQPRPQPPPPSTTAATVPVSKIAVIYSADFQDPKTGIARFAATINKLNAEFQPVQNELNQTSQRLKALQDEIAKMQQGTVAATPQQIQAKIDQLDLQKKDYQRKGEDAQSNYQRRRAELLTPLQEDVGKALDAYGKSRGLTMIIDGSQVPLVYAADSVDITKAFIADYNSKNPATAATTPR